MTPAGSSSASSILPDHEIEHIRATLEREAQEESGKPATAPHSVEWLLRRY